MQPSHFDEWQNFLGNAQGFSGSKIPIPDLPYDARTTSRLTSGLTGGFDRIPPSSAQIPNYGPGSPSLQNPYLNCPQRYGYEHLSTVPSNFTPSRTIYKPTEGFHAIPYSSAFPTGGNGTGYPHPGQYTTSSQGREQLTTAPPIGIQSTSMAWQHGGFGITTSSMNTTIPMKGYGTGMAHLDQPGYFRQGYGRPTTAGSSGDNRWTQSSGRSTDRGGPTPSATLPIDETRRRSTHCNSSTANFPPGCGQFPAGPQRISMPSSSAGWDGSSLTGPGSYLQQILETDLDNTSSEKLQMINDSRRTVASSSCISSVKQQSMPVGSTRGIISDKQVVDYSQGVVSTIDKANVCRSIEVNTQQFQQPTNWCQKFDYLSEIIDQVGLPVDSRVTGNPAATQVPDPSEDSHHQHVSFSNTSRGSNLQWHGLNPDQGSSSQLEDSGRDPARKPMRSYIALITEAIRASPNQRCTLDEIYSYIMNSCPYFKHAKRTTWQNSIRHSLSYNDCFVKIVRPSDQPGKGNYWAMHPGASNMFENGCFQRRQKRFRDPNKNKTPT